MEMRCFGCGVVKDTGVNEYYTAGDELCTDKPIPPLVVIECEPNREDPVQTECRAVVVCHECFHRINPDMWIDRAIWESINPVTPFDKLPPAWPPGSEDDGRWNPEVYAGGTP
jgi:hypothetical protein